MQEWFFSLLLVLFAYLISSSIHYADNFPQIPAKYLGRVDHFNDSDFVIAFAPESKTTQEIMDRVASAPFMKGMCSRNSGYISCWQNTQIHFEIPLINYVKCLSF